MRVPSSRSAGRGFTLIEVMITVAIVGILAAIAYPSYADYIRKGKRATAQAALMELAGKQQTYLLDRRQYTATLADLGFTVPKDIDADYTIATPVDNAKSPPEFTATATPKGSQTKDKCGTLQISHLGVKTAGAAGCW